MSTGTIRLAAASCGLLVAVSSGAQAHHSVAAYDRANPAMLEGTVKEFKYTNPHTRIYLMVPDGNGGESQWELEGAAVNTVVRQGWTTRTLLPGMKVKLLIAPRKDGKDGGEWLRVLEINGKVFEGVKQAGIG